MKTEAVDIKALIHERDTTASAKRRAQVERILTRLGEEGRAPAARAAKRPAPRQVAER
jgi:hypothetical protein